MAAGYLDKPGCPNGPCEGSCAHTDCSQTRRIAASNCTCCGKKIGYGVRFYKDGEDKWAHADCLEDKAERERA